MFSAVSTEAMTSALLHEPHFHFWM